MKIHTLFIAALLAATVQLIGTNLMGAERPNIILLLTDDQNYDTLACTGNDQVRTPNLDRLAGDGLVFRSAYDTTSICMASRAQVMAGISQVIGRFA